MENDLRGMVVITGATSGIGYAAAELLLRNGYPVIGVGSRSERSHAACEKLLASVPGADVLFLSADLSETGEVRRLAEDIRAVLSRRNLPLFCLANNAGGVRDRYVTTSEGFEFTFALNHLAGFLLTRLLEPELKDGIVLFTTSYAHLRGRIHWKDVMLKHSFNVLSAYRQSKLAQVMTAAELQRRGIRAFCVDPGLVKTEIGDKGTRGLARLVWLLRKKKGTGTEIPARTFLYLCGHPDAEGLCFRDSVPYRHNRRADDPLQTDRLFALSESLCGLRTSAK